MSAHPIEVKSGKDYTEHSALNNLLKVPEYNVLAATVISNERKVYQEGKVTYMPVYFVMFMEALWWYTFQLLFTGLVLFLVFFDHSPQGGTISALAAPSHNFSKSVPFVSP